MPVAIRKRSWEEHVSHASGLQYSYDDLDLVCCLGMDAKGSWLGAGSSKQGQRTRCASMPEGYPQLPAEELSQTIKVTATVTSDESRVFKFMQNNVNFPMDLEKESGRSPYDLVDVDIPQGASESEHLQNTELRSHGGPHCNQNSGLCLQNLACEIVRMRTTSEDTEIATKDHNIVQDDNVFKCSHVSHEEKQRISVPSDNESLLTRCAGDQPGSLPDQQETMANDTEGYRRPPNPLDITLIQSSAAGTESPNGLPEVEGEKLSTSKQADARLIPPFGEQGQTDNTMENGDKMTQASIAMEAVATLAEEMSGIQSCSSDSIRNLDGLNPEPQTENVGHERNIQNEGGGKHSCYGCKTKLNEERVELRLGGDVLSDNCLKKTVDTGFSTGAKETYLETVTSARVAFNVSACHENQIVAPQFENGCSKMDTIPEVSHSMPHDGPVHACEDSHFSPNPDVQESYLDDNYMTTEKVFQNLPQRSTEDCDELSPQCLHGNQETSVCDFSKSPGSEVVDQTRAPKEGDVIKVHTKKVRLFSTPTHFR